MHIQVLQHKQVSALGHIDGGFAGFWPAQDDQCPSSPEHADRVVLVQLILSREVLQLNKYAHFFGEVPEALVGNRSEGDELEEEFVEHSFVLHVVELDQQKLAIGQVRMLQSAEEGGGGHRPAKGQIHQPLVPALLLDVEGLPVACAPRHDHLSLPVDRVFEAHCAYFLSQNLKALIGCEVAVNPLVLQCLVEDADF